MMKRDLKADLELCNRATPGPWFAMKGDADIEGLIVTNSAGEMVLAETWYDGPLTAITQENLDMFVQAREGWPHAIERAIKAETLVQKLIDVMETLSRQTSGRCSCGATVTCDLCYPSKFIEESLREIEFSDG